HGCGPRSYGAAGCAAPSPGAARRERARAVRSARQAPRAVGPAAARSAARARPEAAGASGGVRHPEQPARFLRAGHNQRGVNP
ncbi:hypothetical protein ACFSX3_22950, partial [Paenibacillus rhizoplanae]